MRGAYGRIDWMLQPKTWKVIAYTKGRGGGIKEIEIGRASEREAAQALLRDWLPKNKGIVRYA